MLFIGLINILRIHYRMYLEQYKIEGTINLDKNPCFRDPNTFSEFQKGLEMFKDHMTHLVFENEV